MKKYFFLILFLFYSSSALTDDIVYLDIQYIIDNSEIGKFYKNKINDIQKKKNPKLKIKEEEINTKKKEIENQKNILSNEEIDKKIKELNNLVKKYQIQRNDLNKEIIDSKKKYTSKILNILNPLLTNYVEKNNIPLVIEKKNVLVGIKSLDITKNILDTLNEETKKNNLLKND